MPTILSVSEPIESPRKFSVKQRWNRTYERTYYVQFAEMDVAPSYSAFAPGIPRLYASLITTSSSGNEFDFGLQVDDVTSEPMPDNPFIHRVSVHYSNRPFDPHQTQGGGSDGTGNDNPILDPPKVQWGAVHDTKVVEKSKDAVPVAIRNSAKQPFSPRPTVDATRMALTYTRNESSFDAPTSQDYFDNINSTTIWGFDRHQLKIGHITGQREYKNGIRFWVVTYYIEAKYPDWDLHPLDIGTKVLDGAGDPVTKIKNGVPAGEILLDGAGQEAAVGAAPTILGPFQVYDSFDFSILNLTGV